MRAGQVITLWWQRYVLGAFKSPQDLYAASIAENPDAAQASDRFFGVPDDRGWHAPERLRAPSRFLQEAYLSQGHLADWQSVDLRLMRFAAVFVELARKRGIPLYVHCAMRTEAEQAKAHVAGNSKAVYPHSAHNIGEAVDIVHSLFHWDLSPQEWSLLHVLGLRALDLVNADVKKADKLVLTWGGSFKRLYDPAHWEVADYRNRIKRLPVGPPERYTPRAILARVKL